MSEPVKQIKVGQTHLVTFKNLRDGAFVMDRENRILFIKAHQIDMGLPEDNAKTITRLIDPNYLHQYSVVKIASPRLYKIDIINELFRRIKAWFFVKITALRAKGWLSWKKQDE